MSRRRIILATLFLLLTTFVIAVQHDTFIRRWCLPTPPAATRPLGPLDQVIDEFVVEDGHAEDVLRELERRAHMRIEMHHDDAPGSGDGVFRPACTIRRATVEQLLARILTPITPFYLADPFTANVDGTVTLRAGPTSARQTVLRVHDADPVLLRPDANWTAFPWDRAWNTPHGDRIRDADVLTLHYDAPRGEQLDPVLRFGDKLIVITTPRSHWLIDQILREETEAQHANRNKLAATRPAQ